MKEKKLLNALADVDQRYVEEMYQLPKRKRHTVKILWVAAAMLSLMGLLMGSGWIRTYIASAPFANYPLVDPSQVRPEDIHLAVADVTPAYMRVYCSIDGVEEGEDSIFILTGGPFTIEKKTEEGWQQLPARIEDPQWKADRMHTDSGTDWPVNWSGIYGILEPGTYRYSAVVLEGKAPTSVEFTVSKNMEDDLVQVLQDILSSHSYCVRYTASWETPALDHLSGNDRAAMEEMTSDHVSEYWKYGNHYLNQTYVNQMLWTGMMYKNGQKYYLDHEGDDRSNPVIGWSLWPNLDRNRLTEWTSLILEYMDEYEIAYAPDGSVKSLTRIVQRDFECYGLTATCTEVWELDTSDPGAVAAKFVQQDVNSARPFSWKEDRSNKKAQDVTFVNTAAKTITTAPEAARRAMAECTDYAEKVIVYRDEAAGMWKVEFQFLYGYQGYRYVYMDDNGITQMIAEGAPRT